MCSVDMVMLPEYGKLRESKCLETGLLCMNKLIGDGGKIEPCGTSFV